MPKIDPAVYGATEVPKALSVPTPQGVAPAAPYVPPKAVPAASVAEGSTLVAEGRAAVQAANRPVADLWSSTKAAASEWSVARLYDKYKMPTFSYEDGYSPAAQMALAPFSLSPEEEEFLLKSHSHQEFQFKMDRVSEQRQARTLMGDHPVVSFLTSAIDPGYLAIDAMSLGAGRLAASAKAGRAIAGGLAASGAVAMGLQEKDVAPVADSEIILNALLNGAGAAAGFRMKKGKPVLEPVDPEFTAVSGELSKISKQVQANLELDRGDTINPDIGRSAPHGFDASAAFRSGDEFVAHLKERSLGTEYEELARHFAEAPEAKGLRVTTDLKYQDISPNARGFYSSAIEGDLRSALIFLRPDTNLDVAMHETAHAILENRILANPDLRAEMVELRRTIFHDPRSPFRTLSEADKALDATDKVSSPEARAARFFRQAAGMDEGEFIAYSMTSPTFREMLQKMEFVEGGLTHEHALAKLPLKAGTPLPKYSAWDKIMDFFRKVLGLDPKAKIAFDTMMERYNSVPTQMNPKFKPIEEQLQRIMRDAFAGPEGDLYYSLPLRKAGELTRPNLEKIDKTLQTGAERIGWNLHKSLAKFDPDIANVLVDDPLNMKGDSVVSQQRAIKSGLSALQYRYEDELKDALAAEGAGTAQRILHSAESTKIQQRLEADVALEMLRREQRARDGLPLAKETVEPRITKMADALDALGEASVQELKAAGVQGAEELEPRSGYFSRRWDISKIETAEQKLIAAGRNPSELTDLLAQSMQRANAWDAELSHDVAKAILDRTRRKGYMEDTAFRQHAGNDAAAEVRDILTSSGLRDDRLQRAMDVITGVVDEAGKAPILKRRTQMDMFHGIRVGAENIRVADLIDTSLARITDRYVDTVSSNSAFARKGLGSVTAIGNMRKKLLQGVERESDRKDAAYLFDNTVNAIKGLPSGEDMPAAMRKMQAATQMVGLASSGMWQLTEYATTMAKYGIGKTLRYCAKEMPGFSQLLGNAGKDKGVATNLRNILASESFQDIRIRPFTQRLEDGFEIPVTDTLELALNQAKQLVPYLNGMRYVHHHQARVVSNLIVDTFEKGARGDMKARGVLAQYGLTGQVLDKISQDIKTHGSDTAKWANGTWAAVRGPLGKMMDEAVLRNRLGEIPAFAQFSQVGKFIFTFRSFVLGAHNKILAGTMNRDGLHGLSLLMMYQFPLSVMATAANNTIQGKKDLTEQELIAKAMGQMGAMGMFSDLVGVVTGQKQQFGAPGLIALDRVLGVTAAASAGNFSGAGSQLMSSVPLLSVIPGIKAIGESLKTKE